MGFLGCSSISWTICKQSAPRSIQISTPIPHHSFLQAGCSSWCHVNSVKALKAPWGHNVSCVKHCSFVCQHLMKLLHVCVQGFSLSSEQLLTRESFVHDGVPHSLKHGDVVLAAITGCTNASSPSVMLAAGKSATSYLGLCGSTSPSQIHLADSRHLLFFVCWLLAELLY